MSIVERPGIHPNWLTIWNQDRAFFLDLFNEGEDKSVRELENFVLHGNTLITSPISHLSGDFLVKKWENGFIFSYLGAHARRQLAKFEIKSIDENIWASTTARHLFSTMYTEQMGSLSWHAQFPSISNGRVLKALTVRSVICTAFGVVLGCAEAFKLARMQLAAHRKEYYWDENDYPVFHFMFRILADFLGEPAPRAGGDAWCEPVFNSLYDAWRNPDPFDLTELCLAACDIHTFRSLPGPRHHHSYEFADLRRTPIEILLLFKLRQRLGLENPVLDHPLMATALGELPNEVAFEADDLVTRVRARMMQDGYDEDAIFDVCTRA